jgi:NmrA-like family
VCAVTEQELTDTVTMLLRPPTTATVSPGKSSQLGEFESLGVTVEYADVAIASATDLTTVFSRYDTVISCIGFAAGPGTQRKLTEAALAAQVPRYLPWQFGGDYDLIGRGSPQDLFDEQLDVRDLLRGQHTTRWIVISTGMFTSFLFEPAFGVVDTTTNTVHALGSWDTTVTLTTAADIGFLTTRILYAEPPLNGVVYLAGDTLTYRQLADLVDEVLRTDVTRIEWSVEHLLAELAQEPDNTMKKYRAVFGQGVGVAWPVAQSFNAEHAIATTSARRWAQQNLPAAASTP